MTAPTAPRPEISLWPLEHWRPYRITHLKLNGQRIPVADLFRRGAPMPELAPSKRPKPFDFDYYGGVRKVTLYTPTCPHCREALMNEFAYMPAGTCAAIAQQSLVYARWHGHLSTHPDCAAQAFPLGARQ
ncbi:hypothetical protein DM785_02340 [Deinococcus actinosclerus]|nr:hypothetical protein DM785_02340 [Deinococcus actinosclerus]